MSNYSDDAVLIERAQKGDLGALDGLVRKYEKRAYQYAYRLTSNSEEAADVVADAFVRVYVAIGNFKGNAAFTTWLHRIAYTTMIDLARSDQRMSAVEPSEIVRLIDDHGSNESAETAITDAVSTRALGAAVRALPPQQRDAVLLIYGEDMSHAQAATIMLCSEKTVSWHVHDAKKKLKFSLMTAG